MILATGDAVPGLGRIGTHGFGVLGIDDLGRALIETYSGALYWADGERIEPALRCSGPCFAFLLFDELSLGGAFVLRGRAAGLADAEWAVHAVVAGEARRVVAAGDRDGDGNILCDVDDVHINDQGTVGFVAPVVPPEGSCDDWLDLPVDYAVYLASDALLRIGTGNLAPPGVESRGVGLVAVGNDGSAVVSSGRGDSFEVLLVDGGGVRRTLFASGDPGPSGYQLDGLRLLGGNRSGEILFSATRAGAAGLYRTEDGAVRRILEQGEPAPWGGALRSDDVQPVWFSFNDAGDLFYGAGPRGVFVPAGGAAHLAADPVTRGFLNNGGDLVVTDFPSEGITRARRLRDGELRTLAHTGDALPDGGVLATFGIGRSCAAADGVVAAAAKAVNGSEALVCAGARGFAAVSRVGDPAPAGGRFDTFEQCAFAGDSLLFAASTRLPSYGDPGFYTSDAAVYRAATEGIERLIGAGDRTADGSLVLFLGQLPDPGFGRTFSANASGEILARAHFGVRSSQAAFVLRREDGVLERLPALVDVYGADRSTLRTIQIALADSGSVIALVEECRLSGGYCSSFDTERLVVEWSGAEIRRIASARDLADAGAPRPSLGSLVTAGDRLAFTGSGLGPASGWSENRIFTYSLGEEAPAEVLRSGDDSPIGPLVRPRAEALTTAGKLYFVAGDGVQPVDFLLSWDAGEIELLGPLQGAPPLETAGADVLLINDRKSLRRLGPAGGDTTCPAPPTAVPPSATPTATARPTPTPLPPFEPVPLATCREGRPCIRIGSAAGAAGALVHFDASLDTSGALVVGVEASLLLPPVLRPLTCRFDRSIDKPGSTFWFDAPLLQTKVNPEANVRPLPDGALLYVCSAVVSADAPPGVYPIRCVDSAAFDPRGGTLASSCSDGVLIVGAPRPTATPSETATPPPPSPTPTPSATSTATRTPTESATPTETLQPGSGGGCHIDGGGQRGGAWAILLGASALLVARRARSARRVATIAAAAVLSLVRPAGAGCFGDCDGDGRIGIDDLLRQVAVVLGDRPLDDCRSADVLPDGTLSASELVFVIGTALQGCPRPVRFAAAQYVPVGSVADAAVADVDGDGVPDLVTADFYADEVRIHLGRGNGTFAAGRGLSLGPRRDGACQEDLFHPAPGPLAVTLADADGDGALDVITADYCLDGLALALGMAAVVPLEVGPWGEPRFVSTKQPEASADIPADNVSVLFGRGDGGFSRAERFRSLPLLAHSDLKVADVDGDEAPDFIAADREYDSLFVYFGTGAGGFSSRERIDTPVSDWLPVAVETADLNGDHRPDLAVLNIGSGNVTLLYGTGAGRFQARHRFSARTEAADLAVADVNRDGTPDVLVANRRENDVSLSLLRRDGAVAAAQAIGPTGAGPIDVEVADLNGDGRPDFVTADFYYRSVSVFLQQAGDRQPLRSGRAPMPVSSAD